MKLVNKLIIVILIVMAGINVSFGQLSIKGKVLDTAVSSQLNLEASIVLLRAKDSVLVADTRSERNGSFTFKHLSQGKYILLVTHPRYVDYVEHFSLDNTADNSFHVVKLTAKAILLKEVSVKYKKVAAVRLRGDTVEFAADSFRVRPNASVEDLLRTLPGLEVDRNGRITTQGKMIDKVLVDGEEFFSDDPTLVTRNLKANMVDKVQLYDRTSDQAAFTGIDDGKKTKTLNLKLKEDKKQGYFGKLEAGRGTKRFYQNQAMLNSFRGEEKIAAYATLSNTEKIGLDRRSQESYAGGDSNPIGNDLNNWNGTYNGIGIPKSFSGGFHFNNKWNNKESLNTNYKIIGLDINGNQDNTIENDLPGNVLYSNSRQKFKNHLLRNGINASYTVLIDSSSDLKIDIEGSLLNKTTSENDLALTNRQNMSLLNNSTKNISTTGHTKAFNGNFLWRKKLGKDRRTISLNLNTKLNAKNSTGSFYTVNNFFNNNGILDSTEVVNQNKTSDNHDQAYDFKAVYTEPIGRWNAFVFNYGVTIDNSKSLLETFDNSTIMGASGRFDSLYSANYRFDQFSNRGGIAYLYNKEKLLFRFGGDIASNRFEQQDLLLNTILKRRFTNWFSNAELRYHFSAAKSLDVIYNGNTIQPTIQQLQPLVNNEDPLNVYVGNTYLEPSFANTLSASYQYIKNHTYFSVDGTFSEIKDPITLSVVTSTVGKSIYTYVNLFNNTALNYSGSFLFRDKLRTTDLDYGFDGGVDGRKYASLANDLVNTGNTLTYKISAVLSKLKDSVYSVGVSAGANYNVNKTSLHPEINNNFWGYVLNSYLAISLPGRFELQTDGIYTWQGATQTFNTTFSRFIWNADINKKLLRMNNLVIKLSINDILNQNVGFSRRAYDNIIAQSSYNTIARYFMLSVVWDFNHLRKK